MPELILKFNLPEEYTESNIAIGAQGMHSAIWALKQNLRGKLKHGQYTECEFKLLEEINDFLNGELDDNNVTKLFL